MLLEVIVRIGRVDYLRSWCLGGNGRCSLFQSHDLGRQSPKESLWHGAAKVDWASIRLRYINVVPASPDR